MHGNGGSFVAGPSPAPVPLHAQRRCSVGVSSRHRQRAQRYQQGSLRVQRVGVFAMAFGNEDGADDGDLKTRDEEATRAGDNWRAQRRIMEVAGAQR